MQANKPFNKTAMTLLGIVTSTALLIPVWVFARTYIGVWLFTLTTGCLTTMGLSSENENARNTLLAYAAIQAIFALAFYAIYKI